MGVVGGRLGWAWWCRRMRSRGSGSGPLGSWEYDDALDDCIQVSTEVGEGVTVWRKTGPHGHEECSTAAQADTRVVRSASAQRSHMLATLGARLNESTLTHSLDGAGRAGRVVGGEYRVSGGGEQAMLLDTALERIAFDRLFPVNSAGPISVLGAVDRQSCVTPAQQAPAMVPLHAMLVPAHASKRGKPSSTSRAARSSGATAAPDAGAVCRCPGRPVTCWRRAFLSLIPKRPDCPLLVSCKLAAWRACSHRRWVTFCAGQRPSPRDSLWAWRRGGPSGAVGCCPGPNSCWGQPRRRRARE